MKKLCVFILSVIFALSCAACLSACSKDGPSDIAPFDDGNAYNENVSYKVWLTSEEECPAGNIEESKLHAETVIEPGNTYYVVVDFTVFNFSAAGWNSKFNAAFTMADNLSLRLEEASTSDFDETNENGVPRVRVGYSIPRNRSAARGYRVVLQLILSDAADWLDFGVAFYGDAEYDAADYENSYRFMRYSHRVITCRQSEEVKNFVGANTDEVGLYYEKETTHGETAEDIIEEYTVSICAGTTNTVEDGSSVAVIVPLFHDGLPVTKVKNIFGANDYQGSSYKCRIILSDNVREICGDCHLGNTSFGTGPWGARFTVDELVIPSSLKIIHSGSFNVNSLIDLHIVDVAAWCDIEINDSYNDGSSSKNPIFNAGVTYLGKRYMEELVVPDGVKELPQEIFIGCPQLKKVYLPKSLERIGALAFMECYNLEEVYLPQNLQEIYTLAFAYCRKLTRLTIPASVTSIEKQAFLKCDGLISVEFENKEGKIGYDPIDLNDPSANAGYLTNTYVDSYWNF